jgi:hypothetical protein
VHGPAVHGHVCIVCFMSEFAGTQYGICRYKTGLAAARQLSC